MQPTKKERFAKQDDSQFPDPDFTGSPAIKRIEMYRCDGINYDSFEKAISSREDKVEAFIRPMFNSLSPLAPGDYITAMEWILSNRAELRKLLDY